MDKERFLEILPNPAEKLPEITGVKPLEVTTQNYGTLAKQEFEKLRKRIDEGLYCPSLGNRKIAGFLKKHLKRSHGMSRKLDDVIQRVSIMPFITPVIEKGVFRDKRIKDNGVNYKLSARTAAGDISVILVEDKKGLLYLSVFPDTTEKTNSLTYTDGSTAGAYVGKAFTLKGQGVVSLNRNINIPDIYI
jgi:hypothetical protein